MTYEQMLEYGYVFEGDSFYLPSGIIPPEAYFPSTMLVSEPKYPNFDPRKLPWSEAPTAVQEILSMNTDKANTTDLSSYEMPFISIRVNSSNIYVFVGINCYLGVTDSKYNVRVCTSAAYYPGMKTVCYSATFNHNLTVKSDWRQLDYTDWGDLGNVMTYSSSTYIADDYNLDLYVYGGNGARVNSDSGSPTSVSFQSTSSTKVCCYMNNRMGFSSNNNVLWGSLAGHFPDVYISTFRPPTIQEMEQETQKGIFDTLKSIPDTIADKFKGLFIPAEGYFDTYIQEYQDYFSERFGLLYEIPDSIADIFQQLIEFNPAEEGYYIDFPEVVMPVLENGEWRDVVLIEDTKVTFDFLDEGPIATLYSMYRAALWLLFIFLLINLIIRKSDKVFGGGSG